MQLPGPVRAVVGLIANAADEAKNLPDRAMELPMLAVSTALQMSLRAQQRYARLAARGDDVIHRRPPTDEPPAWATFDDPVPLDELRGGGAGAQRDAQAASDLLDELLNLAERAAAAPAADDTAADDGAIAPVVPHPAVRAAAKKTTPAKKVTAKKVTAKKVTAKPAAAKTAKVAKSVKVAKAATKGADQPPAAPKKINKPRHIAPSAFDTVDDE